MNKVARFLERTDTLMGGLETLSRSSPFERLDRTLTRLDELVAGATTGSTRAFARVDEMAAQMSVVLARTERMLVTADSAIRSVGPGLNDTQKEALATLRDTRALVVDLRGTLQQQGNVEDMLRNFTTVSENLVRFTDRLDRDPASLLVQQKAPKKTVGPPIIRD
jgi:hypothetical protein